MECPSCKKRIDAPHCKPLVDEMKDVISMEEDVLKKSMERAKFEDLHKNPRLKDPNDRFYNDLRSFSIYKLSYYQCFKCKSPYFGGMKDCE
jgi:E3 ubiquitin-protein ligase MYCBP2